MMLIDSQTPNVSRLLIRYGVDKVIGKNLVSFRELNLRQKDGTKAGHTPIKRVEDTTGYPWWLVHRHHLHNGLVKVAEDTGVQIMVNTRIAEMDQLSNGQVSVASEDGRKLTFDLVVGSDGVRSFVRKDLFPDVKPKPPTSNAAYRAIVPFEEVRNDPMTRELVEDEDGKEVRTMEVWMAPTGYVISYPIADGKNKNETKRLCLEIRC